MPITVKEIAQIAGVSRGTVDRALKDRPGVNLETKKRILQIVKENNYKPNLIGKALVYSNKRIPVKIILNSAGNPFFDDVIKGIKDAQSDYSLYGIETDITEMKGYDESKQLSALSSIEPNVKNVIITPIDTPAVKSKIDDLSAHGVNVITLSADVDNCNRKAYVGCDYLKSGLTAGRLVSLLSGGKANLCIVTGSVVHKGHKQRIDGIKEALKNERNIKIAEIVENNDDDEASYRKSKDALEKNPLIDFVYSTAGGVGGTLKAVKESKRNIKICSFDDVPVIKKALCDGDILATIYQQPYKQGYEAVKLIYDIVIAKNEIKANNYFDLYIKIDQSI